MKFRTSVVIPAYNEEKYLKNTLISLVHQTVAPDEIIVVDGGSTDHTPSICRDFGTTRVVQNQRGISAARQLGLETASGDIVACTDADTIVPSDWLEKIIHTLISRNAVGVYGSYQVIDGVWWYKFLINVLNKHLMSVVFLLGRDIPGGQNMAFFRDKALQAGGFPLDFQSVEDFEIMRRLRTQGKIIFLSKNCVLSSGRRGKEGFFPLCKRILPGMINYFTRGKADAFSFPDIR